MLMMQGVSTASEERHMLILQMAGILDTMVTEFGCWATPHSEGCSMEEFVRVCTVCVERGILDGFFEEPPTYGERYFWVGKPGGCIRLIVDSRHGNLPLPDPMPAFLPRLGVICDLPTRAGEDVLGAVSDLDSYYNKLRLPVWMRWYCAWMPVWSDLVGLSGARRKVWPWMLC
eukprot:jgi/Mesvir1/8081/Mv25266-RA.1